MQRRESLEILADLFGNGRGKNTGVRSGIGGQLLLIKFLRRLQSLVRTDLEKAGAVILKFRQVIEKGRILFFLFPADR